MVTAARTTDDRLDTLEQALISILPGNLVRSARISRL